MRVTVRSLAKINLDLRVLRKRADGFHELRTVFQTISLADTIEVAFEPGRRSAIQLHDPLNIPDNLVVRAADAVIEANQARGEVSIRLRKRVPMGGGLGGGSSNAAAILLALPVLMRRGIPFEQLAEIAAELGSDVPFFLMGGTAMGMGRGEELYPLPEVRPEPILVVTTGIHVSTPAAYEALGRTLTWPEGARYSSIFRSYVRALGDRGSAGAAAALSGNDFESAVFQAHPLLKTVAGKLSKLGAKGVRMTGSGSAIFGIFESAASRSRAQAALSKEWKVTPATLVSRKAYRRMWRNRLREFVDLNSDIWPPHSRYER